MTATKEQIHSIICSVIFRHCKDVQLPRGIRGLEDDLTAALLPLPASALALSSRDKEIREVLEGLVISRYDDAPCWCDKGRAIPMGLNHEPACLAARVLWERVQG